MRYREFVTVVRSSRIATNGRSLTWEACEGLQSPLRSLFLRLWAVRGHRVQYLVVSILIPSGSERWILERDAAGETYGPSMK
jgi:hypothetical protein